MEDQLLQQAIHEPVEIAPYDSSWPEQFELEKSRLVLLFPELIEIQHIGSTAVPGLSAKPIIDLMAIVASMPVTDELLPKLCENGYVTSAEFNATLDDRRWLMRHAGGRRTHHLHLVLPNSEHWSSTIGFRDRLRADAQLAAEYAALKKMLSSTMGSDREAYTAAKSRFIMDLC